MNYTPDKLLTAQIDMGQLLSERIALILKKINLLMTVLKILMKRLETR